ncbi:hypothetical protein E6C27_scaffold131G00520 [Cucumis melo var. makuwa]|uniref:Uncharacterized protein n=1 Tax=Cucumis melo var. makuwa TaxID=1194695 RepID=A0A5A7UIN9_CUCMM|nr:hypothetical protein E6C27_scaffold131G00520 [Cucumis melo var. makuwa]
MIISDKWGCYIEDGMVKARRVKELVLDDDWWDKIDYTLSFTTPIYDMIRDCDTDIPCLHLVYDIYDMPLQSWWAIHGAFTPTLQSLAMKLLVQPHPPRVVREIGAHIHFLSSDEPELEAVDFIDAGGEAQVQDCQEDIREEWRHVL